MNKYFKPTLSVESLVRRRAWQPRTPPTLAGPARPGQDPPSRRLRTGPRRTSPHPVPTGASVVRRPKASKHPPLAIAYATDAHTGPARCTPPVPCAPSPSRLLLAASAWTGIRRKAQHRRSSFGTTRPLGPRPSSCQLRDLCSRRRRRGPDYVSLRPRQPHLHSPARSCDQQRRKAASDMGRSPRQQIPKPLRHNMHCIRF